MNTGNNPIYSDNGLLTTLAAGSTKDKPEYALEGSVFVAGAVVQWLRDELRMIKDAASTKEYAMKVENTAGVYIVPAFSGLGAPYLAGLATGYWKDKDEIKKNWRLDAEYDAHMSPDERRKLLKNWKHAVNSALFWAEAAEK